MAYSKQIWENAPSTNSPLNADRLNHMEDGIYNAYNQIKDNYTESGTDAYSCNYANNNFASMGTILWVNPNTSTSFASQNITLSSDNYDVLEIYVKQATGNSRIQSTKLLKGYDGMLYTEFDTGLIARRLATRVSDTVYTIGNVQSTSEYTNNTNVIPVCVIGYNTTLFD